MNRRLLSLWVTLGFLVAGAGCGARRDSGGPAVAGGATSASAASPSNSVVANNTDNPVLVTFDGGELRRDEFEGHLDATTGFNSFGQKMDPRVLCRANSSYLDGQVEIAALGKVAVTLVRDHNLDPHRYFETELENNVYRATWTYYMLTRMHPEKIEPARLAFEEKMHQYYDEHRGDFIKTPGQVSFRMIFLNTLGADDAARGEKRALAERLSEELKAAPARFVDLAKEYSDAEPDVRGQVFGPYDPTKINKELANALEPLSPGDISSAVENPKGFYLLRLESRGEPEYKTFQDVWRYIYAELGGFYTFGIVDEYRKELLGDAEEPVFLFDNFSTDTSKSDAVIARYAGATLTNREANYILLILVDATKNDPNDAVMLLKPIIDKKALYEALKKKGFLDSPRYRNYIEAYRRNEYLEYLRGKATRGELKASFPNWTWEGSVDGVFQKEMHVTIVRRPDL